MTHQNLHGECPGCEKVFDRYPGFWLPLRMWFGFVRRSFFDAHISDAGRGKIDQQVCFHRGTSKAEWTQSAHNWNAAIDLWFLDPAKVNHYSLERAKFNAVFDKCPLDTAFEWYGAPHAPFPELPHVQLRDWREAAQRGDIKLVEPV